MNSERWKTGTIGDLLSLEYGAGLKERDRSGLGYPVYGSNGVVGFHKKYLVNGPGIIVGRKGSVGAVHWSDDSFWPIDTAYYVEIKKEDINLRWCYWALQFIELSRLDSSTGVPGLNRNDVYKLRINLPNEQEQLQIAHILDTVDEAIQRTEQLIAKLKAIKQGLLHDLLTRGLDENGQLRDPIAHPEQFKDSPLGRIPKEWRLTSLGKIARIRRGASPRPIDSPEWFANKGVGWVRISDVTKAIDRLTETEQYLSPSGEKKSVRVCPGQIIMSICATIGEPIILGMDACIHDGFVVFDQHEHSADPGFLVRFLRYKQDYFKSQGQTGTQANLNTNIVKDCLIALPSIEEQRTISEIMDCYDNSLKSESEYFTKLKLLKKGLMHDLLTGKVRVNIKTENLNQVKEGEL
jgi:type I restriction enzyme S subunit